jgi:LacI family transcriptional regulator
VSKQRGSVTIADVAREAGVSLMTVSRAVNGKDGISEATRERIQEIVTRLGYRPSDIARSLVTDRTGTIGLVVIDNSNSFFSEIARGAEHEAYEQGYNVFLCNTEEDIEREQTILRSLEEKRVDGLLLCSPRLDTPLLLSAVKRHDAVVMINRPIIHPHVGRVAIRDECGGQIATEHLLSRGHRNVGFLAGPERSHSGQLREKGYHLALEQAGIAPHPEWVRRSLPVVEFGREAALDLLTHQPEITALFCYNDLSAVGALQACAHLGRRVPDDIAIVGFDDIPLASLVTPPLTTCHIPLYDLGNQAMRMLLRRINGCTEDCDEIVIEPELIIRASAP